MRQNICKLRKRSVYNGPMNEMEQNGHSMFCKPPSEYNKKVMHFSLSRYFGCEFILLSKCVNE